MEAARGRVVGGRRRSASAPRTPRAGGSSEGDRRGDGGGSEVTREAGHDLCIGVGSARVLLMTTISWTPGAVRGRALSRAAARRRAPSSRGARPPAPDWRSLEQRRRVDPRRPAPGRRPAPSARRSPGPPPGGTAGRCSDPGKALQAGCGAPERRRAVRHENASSCQANHGHSSTGHRAAPPARSSRSRRTAHAHRGAHAAASACPPKLRPRTGTPASGLA